jgi:hypothetical protein
MTSLTKLKVKDYLILIRWYVLSFIGGLIVVLSYPDSCRLATLVHKAADAFMIAGVIGVVIELSSLNRLLEYVGSDVAQRLSAIHLPNEIRQQIWQVINSEFVYEDYQRSYRLSRSSGKMQVESTISYKVRNYGFSDLGYSPMLGDEIIHKPKFLSVEYRLTSGEGHAFNEDQLIEFTGPRRATKVGSQVKGLPRLLLHSKDRMPQEVCTVTWRYVAEMPEEYSDITAFGGATVNPVIQLEDIPADMDFICDGEGVEQLPGGKRWVFKRPFIKDQHVRVWWHRRVVEHEG